MVKALRLSEARGAHEELAPAGQTGDPLLYLGAGDDIGCSVALFWGAASEFYFVDPYTKESDLDSKLGLFQKGTDTRSAGFPLASATLDTSVKKVKGVDAAHYKLVSAGTTKSLYLLKCTTSVFLDAIDPGLPSYAVVVCKDYAGIDNSTDAEFPYFKLWDKLKVGGLFAETLGAQRASERADFGRYQMMGLSPLHKVTEESGTQIGFAQGLVVFKKAQQVTATNAYEGLWDSFERVEKAMGHCCATILMGGYTPKDLGEATYEDGEEDLKEGDAKLIKIMNSATTKRWSDFVRTETFVKWLGKRVSKKDPGLAQLTATPAFDAVAQEVMLKWSVESWGTW